MPGARDSTVAVATCGRPDGLTRCLEALAGGTARPGEVHHRGPRANGTRAGGRACTGLEVRYLEQPRLGLSASRNLGAGVGDICCISPGC